MSYRSPYTTFTFESYEFNATTSTATFTYSFDKKRFYSEQVVFQPVDAYDEHVLNRALQLAWMLTGISYYKSFPTRNIVVNGGVSEFQADFFNMVYLHGLSQFVYENGLEPTDIAEFSSSRESIKGDLEYTGDGTLVLQSGGKDSLLLAELLTQNNQDFTAWYMSQKTARPDVLNMIGSPIRQITRTIDRTALAQDKQDGGLNGHVPVTYITLAYAVVDAVLHNESIILTAIGREGEEPHAYMGDYAVTHQWSKTWHAEQRFAEYVKSVISSNLRVGSPLRGMSELKIAELFVKKLWQKVGHSFSSCNLANYKQGHDNQDLTWCGECPKCANSFVLFAAFVGPDELKKVFGENLFKKASMQETYKGLFGVGDAEKPFECVGEIDELRKAYNLALSRGYEPVSFDVPDSNFDKDTQSPMQQWAEMMIQ